MSQQKTILVVDDEVVNVMVLIRALEPEYRILTAHSGKEAIDVAHSELPDLILLDIMMPEMDGYAVLNGLKNNGATRHIPIIFVTAKTCEADEALGLELGAVDYICKPIRLNIALKRIRNHMELRLHTELLEYLTNELDSKNKQLELLCREDSLTKLANRKCFDELLASEINRSCRDRIPLSLIMFDIDRFKQFNDSYGHQCGDDCLREIAKVCRTVFRRAGDIVARYGGEEFAVILPNTLHHEAKVLAEDFCAKVRGSIITTIDNGRCLPCPTISIGGVTVIAAGDTSETQLIALADASLYESKNNGRDRVSWHSD